ncbi:unnamed protein product [Symbiodinium sp. KB8]|nr:unnamed protein product [Symbiodinium sp. KB8]
MTAVIQAAPLVEVSREEDQSEYSLAICKIFTIAFPDADGIPLAFHLNVNSWQRHTRDVCDEPVLINDTNVKHYIPDLPKEYFHLPGSQDAKQALHDYEYITKVS